MKKSRYEGIVRYCNSTYTGTKRLGPGRLQQYDKQQNTAGTENDDRATAGPD